jgi:hypothetical protein
MSKMNMVVKVLKFRSNSASKMFFDEDNHRLIHQHDASSTQKQQFRDYKSWWLYDWLPEGS